VELARRGRSAEPELDGDGRWAQGADGEKGNDLPPRRVGEEFDTWSAAMWHLASIMPLHDYLPIFSQPRGGVAE
jgi:hypothetical protein